jgi:uncharacterized protein YcfJ
MKNLFSSVPIRSVGLVSIMGMALLSLSACAPMQSYPDQYPSQAYQPYQGQSQEYQSQQYENQQYENQRYPTVRTRTVCRDVRVADNRGQRDPNNVAGTAIGAIAGGLLGHTVGGGSGKTLATIGGAVAGGYVGNRVENNGNQNAGYGSSHIERQCQQEQY